MGSEMKKKWEEKRLSDLLDSLESGSRPKGGVRGFTEGIPSIGGEHINDKGGFIFENIKYVPVEFAAKMTKGQIQQGDVLIVKDGATTGKTSFVYETFPFSEAVVNEHVFICRPNDKVIPNYLFWYLWSEEGNQRILQNFKGSAQGGINKSFADNTKVPVAPLDEQKKIVEKIEQLMPRIASCKSRLDRIPLLLKRFRQSVLAAAVSGELTRGWREENKNIENADQILQRIEKEKAKFVKEKKVIQKQSDFELVQLPEKWKWGAWEDYLDYSDSPFRRGPFGSSLKKEIFISSGYKIYEQYCPINDDCSFSRYFIDEKKFKELKNFAVKAGDFLISCSGVTLGRITRVPEKYDEGIINQALLRVRINNNFFDSNFFLLLFRSPYFQKSIFENSTGSAIPNVKGVNELKAIPAPLLSLEEQNEIVRIVNALFFISDNIESRYNHLKRYTDSLPQAILRGVFGRGGIEK